VYGFLVLLSSSLLRCDTFARLSRVLRCRLPACAAGQCAPQHLLELHHQILRYVASGQPSSASPAVLRPPPAVLLAHQPHAPRAPADILLRSSLTCRRPGMLFRVHPSSSAALCSERGAQTGAPEVCCSVCGASFRCERRMRAVTRYGVVFGVCGGMQWCVSDARAVTRWAVLSQVSGLLR
jgi:hypothetical protein